MVRFRTDSSIARTDRLQGKILQGARIAHPALPKFNDFAGNDLAQRVIAALQAQLLEQPFVCEGQDLALLRLKRLAFE